jgi:hypothetical protein
LEIFAPIVGLMLLVAVGVVPALPVLLPPVRATLRKSRVSRIGTMIICGIVAFSIMYAAIVWLGNDIKLVFANIRPVCDFGPCQPQEDENLLPIYQIAARELWMRNMIPFTLEGVCFTTPTECEAADKLIALTHGLILQRNVFAEIGMSSFPALISTLTVQFLTNENNSRMKLGYKSINEEPIPNA